MARRDISWQAPAFTETPQKRQSWVEEACISEGENWLKGQPAYQDIPKALQVISGKVAEDANQKHSNLNINHAKYILRKIVGTLSDIHIGAQYTSDAKQYDEQTEMFNRAAKAVCLEAQFSRRLRMSLQYMSATAKGYLWPKFERMPREEGAINFEPLGLLDVLPVQLTNDNDLQKAYSVTIIVMMPVWMAHGKFPHFQHSLLPIARRKYLSTVAARRLDLAERFKYGESMGENWANLYCEMRYTFIRDLSINETSDTKIPMGEPDTSWFYEVPYIGQDIFAGIVNGRPAMRKAEAEDCMLYPYRRLIITSRGMSMPLYDGPAKDWHGMVPLAEYCADDWPWEPAGFSLTHDIFSSERARQSCERLVDQLLKARLDPTITYDRNSGVNDQTALTLDPFEERGRVGVDGDISKVFGTALPQWMLEIPTAAEAWIKYLNDSEDAQLGLNEITNLAEFKANINSDQAMDKALSLVGPLVKDISAGMEASTVNLWNMLKYMIPQYMTTKRMMQYVGADGISPETFDYDPNTLIPSHGPDEFHNMDRDLVIANPSLYSRVERARQFAGNLRLISVPHTMHEITQTQEQMKWLMLHRSGFPVAAHDVAKKLNIENYGEIDGNTYFERYFNEQKLMISLKAQLAKLAQAEMPAPPPGSEDTSPVGPKGGQKVTGGRPPSGNKPPKLKTKTSGPAGPRVVQSTSG